MKPRLHAKQQRSALPMSLLCALPVCASVVTPVLRSPSFAHADKRSAHAARTGSAKAAGISGSDAHANRLLDRGINQLAQRDLIGARQSLELSFRAHPQTIILFYLGAVAVADGRALDAHDLMRRYLADPSLTDIKSDEHTTAEGVLSQPLPAHGFLQVLGDAGVLISVDDHVVGVLPLSRPLLLSPGRHRVALEAHGHRVEAQVDIALGRPAELQHHAASNSFTLRTARSLLLIDRYAGPLGEAQVRVGQAIEHVLAEEHYTAQHSEAALESAREPALRACLDTLPCQLGLAKAIGSDLLLHARTGPAQRATEIDIELTAYSVEVSQAAGSTTLTCPLPCSADLAQQLIKARLPELLQQAQSRPRGRLVLTSQPVGAEVFLRHGDEWERLGLTPLEQVLWVGRHELQLRMPGRTPVNRSLQLETQPPLQLAIELPRDAKPSAEIIWVRRPRPQWRIGLSAGLGVVGLGLSIAGISGLAVNGQCVGGLSSTLPGAQCLNLYATGAIGSGLLTAGLLTLGGAALTLAIPEPLRPQVQPQRSHEDSTEPARRP